MRSSLGSSRDVGLVRTQSSSVSSVRTIISSGVVRDIISSGSVASLPSSSMHAIDRIVVIVIIRTLLILIVSTLIATILVSATLSDRRLIAYREFVLLAAGGNRGGSTLPSDSGVSIEAYISNSEVFSPCGHPHRPQSCR